MDPFADPVVEFYAKLPPTSPAQDLAPERAGWALPGTALDPRMQRELIDVVRREGARQGGTYTGPGGTKFWNALTLRTIDRATLPPAVAHVESSKLEFFYRLRPDIGWEWVATPITETVKRLVAPYEPLFTRLSRVKIFMQVPDERTPFHKDLVPGNKYLVKGPYSYARGEERVMHRGAPWLDALDPAVETDGHRLQSYFALKIPLTERDGEYGHQAIVLDRPYLYEHGGDMYFMNEAMWHGAEASPFFRGVVFLDGILDMRKVAELPKKPLALKPFDYGLSPRTPAPSAKLPLRGIDGKPYVVADHAIDVATLKSLREEIEVGLVKSHRVISAPGPNGLPDDGVLDISEARIAASKLPSDHPIRRHLESFKDINDIRLYLKIAMKAVTAGFGVNLRHTVGAGWDGKNAAAACAWGTNAAHFPGLVRFVEGLPFDEIGRVHIFFQEPYCPVACHYDGDRPDRAPHANEFLWMQLDLDKKFFVYDAERDVKHVIRNYAVFFNEKDYHGADPIPVGAISLRVDGRFSPAFRRKLELSDGPW